MSVYFPAENDTIFSEFDVLHSAAMEDFEKGLEISERLFQEPTISPSALGPETVSLLSPLLTDSPPEEPIKSDSRTDSVPPIRINAKNIRAAKKSKLAISQFTEKTSDEKAIYRPPQVLPSGPMKEAVHAPLVAHREIPPFLQKAIWNKSFTDVLQFLESSDDSALIEMACSELVAQCDKKEHIPTVFRAIELIQNNENARSTLLYKFAIKARKNGFDSIVAIFIKEKLTGDFQRFCYTHLQELFFEYSLPTGLSPSIESISQNDNIDFFTSTQRSKRRIDHTEEDQAKISRTIASNIRINSSFKPKVERGGENSRLTVSRPLPPALKKAIWNKSATEVFRFLESSNDVSLIEQACTELVALCDKKEDIPTVFKAIELNKNNQTIQLALLYKFVLKAKKNKFDKNILNFVNENLAGNFQKYCIDKLKMMKINS